MQILIAEDDPVSLSLVRKALETLGHECTVVQDGERAWEAFTELQPDVIISDWQMPALTGLELCRKVREHGGPYVYFILLTSNTRAEQRMEGMLAGADDYLTKPFNQQELRLRLISAERVTQLHRRIAEQQNRLKLLNEKLYKEGRRCILTGVANRLQLQEDLNRHHALAARHARPYCLAIFDIDFFKRYNDTCGHVAGDEVLRSVAEALESCCRVSDRLYRYGGEEFVALFPDGDLGGAEIATERMREAVESLAIAHPGRTDLPLITVSAGVARCASQPSYTIEQFIEIADKGLYEAKRTGKNRVVVVAEDS